MTSPKFTAVAPQPKGSHADIASRDLTTSEYKQLCDFTFAATGTRALSEYDTEKLGEEAVKSRQDAIYKQLGLKTEKERTCLHSIAFDFMFELGVDSDTSHFSPDYSAAGIDHSRITNSTKDITESLARVRDRYKDKNGASYEFLEHNGVTLNDIDAALKIFTNHINGTILSKQRGI